MLKPIAAPTIGGMVITPVIFYIMKRRTLRTGTLTVSGMNF